MVRVRIFDNTVAFWLPYFYPWLTWRENVIGVGGHKKKLYFWLSVLGRSRFRVCPAYIMWWCAVGKDLAIFELQMTLWPHLKYYASAGNGVRTYNSSLLLIRLTTNVFKSLVECSFSREFDARFYGFPTPAHKMFRFFSRNHRKRFSHSTHNIMVLNTYI